ncbi:hypothetical protein [Vibrio coralliilyticus]|uniref:hypothetical protein n=1 Tax=Vibrio coralliilyticus TaxID=190893 RepID=UPI0006CC49E8|nr:hypothetical protein [Vibrio coralliilyticus]AXN34390.1 hypothetical protein DVV14_24515 [Vibrio coralliilyticus]KPH24082.1 hypothetical protein ADU60_22005 [Vibrio coralliilyticus]
MKPTLPTLSALVFLTLSYSAIAKDLYFVTYDADKPYNELQVLDLNTKESSKIEDINGGGRLAVTQNSIYLATSTPSTQALWRVTLDGEKNRMVNKIPMTGDIPVIVDKETSQVYTSSMTQDTVVEVYPDYTDSPGAPIEGEDFRFIFGDTMEDCGVGYCANNTALAIDNANERMYMALGVDQETEVISFPLGEHSTVDRRQELSVEDGIDHYEDWHKIIAMHLDPKDKYLYFANEHAIYRANIKGESRQVEKLLSIEESNGGVQDLEADFEAGKLYWTENRKPQLYSADLSGENVKVEYVTQDGTMFELAFMD